MLSTEPCSAATSARIIAEKVDFAEPCSPDRTTGDKVRDPVDRLSASKRLVPRHRGFDGLRLAEDGEVLGINQQFDASGDAGFAGDEARALKGEHHLERRQTSRPQAQARANTARRRLRRRATSAIEAGIGVGGSTVYRTKRRFVEDGLEAALSEQPRPGAERKLTGKEEALLIATACSAPPAGRARWTLELLAGEMVSLTEHGSLSRETVRRRWPRTT